MTQAITIDYQDAIAHVKFDRGMRKNALSIEIIKELTRTAEMLRDRHDLVAVVLSGSAEAFSAGADQKDPERFDIHQKPVCEQRHILSWGSRMCKAWEDLPQLTIAAVEGFNVGGGVALTLACDWRVMSEDAYLYVPEVQIGISLGWHTVPRLVNMVGPSRAKQVMLLGDKMDSRSAKEWGLADWLTPAGEATAFALQIAKKVSNYPPYVVKMSKQSVNGYANALNHAATFMDVDQALLCGKSPASANARKRYEE
ncbi:enoyl-CoA hydratase/isomerase family protein [Alcaligenaceae bacterium]|nr:enoyl-CoA hydratase/isomerase family protein [Alcaligenaceae bacterium]